MTVVDLWVNALTGKAAAAFVGQAGNEGIPDRLRVASDHPFLPMDRAVAAAPDLPLSDTAARAFLGGTAARLLHLG